MKNRPLTAAQLNEFRRVAQSFRPNSDDLGVGPAILALLIEVERLKAAFVPRPVPEASWLEKDFHALYLATERLVAHLDLEAEFDLSELNDVKAQLHRMLPAFEECEAARVLAKRTKEGN